MNPSDLNAIVAQGDAKRLVTQAETLGEQLVKSRLSTSQIRNIFGTVRRIEMNWPENPQSDVDRERVRKAQRELLLLKPKMAYQAKRERGRGVQELTDVLGQAIDLVGDDRIKFQNFVDFFEAVLAYHKAYGGK